MKLNNFHYIAIMLDMLYGIEIEDEDLEELGLYAWELIGNKNIKLYRFSADIDPVDLSITLPCNATSELGGEIEAVTSSYEDWSYVTNHSDNGDFRTSHIENSIESLKFYPSKFYISGKLLDYTQSDDKLYFAHNYGKINVLYKGVLSDEEGLPQVTDKEAVAIATYIAHIVKTKEAIVSSNPNIQKLADALYISWNKKCDQARVTYLNQNDMNKILDVSATWGRHVFSKSTKPIL